MITFYFDCSSPWTYLAFHNIGPLAHTLDVEIDWKPILVGGVFNAVNDSVYEARKSGPSPKARYHGKDLQDWARLAGLNIKMPPSVFPVNSVKVMRACILLKPEGKLVDFAAEAFKIYWSEDQDISQDELVREICRRANVDADRVMAGIRDQTMKDQLRANTDELIARGGFGSPTMFVGDDMYFGNDRLVLVAEAVKRAKAT
ncbi:MAG: 2-hydroxychromene-2-carboxylate isomerase [Pseudomonadota bacterium]|nr:2-hydroxychromene-2-carboxylate isomerase [Pseudomonadota bacterium]